MPGFSVYECTHADGSSSTVLTEHGMDSADLGAEMVELLGAGFRNRDVGRITLAGVRAEVRSHAILTRERQRVRSTGAHGAWRWIYTLVFPIGYRDSIGATFSSGSKDQMMSLVKRRGWRVEDQSKAVS